MHLGITSTPARQRNGGAGFIPIGNSQNPFTGSLNGDGFAINNLTINSSAAYVGLFGMIGSGGSVQNLGIGNISLTATGWNGSGGDYAHVGALAGTQSRNHQQLVRDRQHHELKPRRHGARYRRPCRYKRGLDQPVVCWRQHHREQPRQRPLPWRIGRLESDWRLHYTIVRDRNCNKYVRQHCRCRRPDRPQLRHGFAKLFDGGGQRPWRPRRLDRQQ